MKKKYNYNSNPLFLWKLVGLKIQVLSTDQILARDMLLTFMGGLPITHFVQQVDH